MSILRCHYNMDIDYDSHGTITTTSESHVYWCKRYYIYTIV